MKCKYLAMLVRLNEGVQRLLYHAYRRPLFWFYHHGSAKLAVRFDDFFTDHGKPPLFDAISWALACMQTAYPQCDHCSYPLIPGAPHAYCVDQLGELSDPDDDDFAEDLYYQEKLAAGYLDTVCTVPWCQASVDTDGYCSEGHLNLDVLSGVTGGFDDDDDEDEEDFSLSDSCDICNTDKAFCRCYCEICDSLLKDCMCTCLQCSAPKPGGGLCDQHALLWNVDTQGPCPRIPHEIGACNTCQQPYNRLYEPYPDPCGAIIALTRHYRTTCTTCTPARTA